MSLLDKAAMGGEGEGKTCSGNKFKTKPREWELS